MIDKAAIFTELTSRNAIRRQAQLPLLDMRDEFYRAVEFSQWKTAAKIMPAGCGATSSLT
jgi:hypothetical protein